MKLIEAKVNSNNKRYTVEMLEDIREVMDELGQPHIDFTVDGDLTAEQCNAHYRQEDEKC